MRQQRKHSRLWLLVVIICAVIVIPVTLLILNDDDQASEPPVIPEYVDDRWPTWMRCTLREIVTCGGGKPEPENYRLIGVTDVPVGATVTLEGYKAKGAEQLLCQNLEAERASCRIWHGNRVRLLRETAQYLRISDVIP